MERREPGAGVPELAEYADGFVAWLGGLGYSPRTCEAQVALLRHLARWLAQQSVPLSGLSSEVAGEYAAVRRGQLAHLRSDRALRPVLRYLRELGAVPPASAVVPGEPVDVLLARFGGWLSRERGPGAGHGIQLPVPGAAVRRRVRRAARRPDRCPGLGPGRRGRRGHAAAVCAGPGERGAGAAAFCVAGGHDRGPAGGVRRVVRRPGRPGRAEGPQPRAGRRSSSRSCGRPRAGCGTSR